MIPEAVAYAKDVAEFGPYARWVAQLAKEEEEEVYRWGRREKPTPGEQWDNLILMRAKLGASRDRAAWLQFHSAITGWNPDPWQVNGHLAESWNSKRSHKLFSCGIGVGKTEFLVQEHAMLHVVNPGADHLMIAPTYDQVENVLLDRWEQIMEAYAERGYPILRSINRSKLIAYLHCGGRVFFRSADKIANQRGTQYCSIGLDEGEYVRDPLNVLTTLLGRLRARNCFVRQFTVATTPRGLAGGILEYWHQMRQAMRAEARNPSEAAVKLSEWWFDRIPSFANPRLESDFFEAIKGYSRRRFEEEILGYPSASAVTILPEYSAERHGVEYTYDPKRPYDLMCDWGYNYPYFGWIQPTQKGQAVHFAEYCEDQVSEERQLNVLAEMAGPLPKGLGQPPARIAVDREDPGMIQKVARLFPKASIVKMESRQEQARAAGIESLRALIDPLFGDPLYLVAKPLIEKGGRRGIHQAFAGRKWAQRNGIMLPWPDTDLMREHAFDAATYWARAFGHPGAVAATVHWATRGFADLRMREAARWASR